MSILETEKHKALKITGITRRLVHLAYRAAEGQSAHSNTYRITIIIEAADQASQ